MRRASRKDMFVIRMGLDTLLEHVHQTEVWWSACGDSATRERIQRFANAIRATRQKFFANADDSYVDRSQALIVAEGLRDAARQCREGQGALHARLVGGAETIERLCRSKRK